MQAVEQELQARQGRLLSLQPAAAMQEGDQPMEAAEDSPAIAVSPHNSTACHDSCVTSANAVLPSCSFCRAASVLFTQHSSPAAMHSFAILASAAAELATCWPPLCCLFEQLIA